MRPIGRSPASIKEKTEHKISFRLPTVLGITVKFLEKAMVLSKGSFIGLVKVISGLTFWEIARRAGRRWPNLTAGPHKRDNSCNKPSWASRSPTETCSESFSHAFPVKQPTRISIVMLKRLYFSCVPLGCHKKAPACCIESLKAVKNFTCRNMATGMAGFNSLKSRRQAMTVLKNFRRWSSANSIKNSMEKIPLPESWCSAHLVFGRKHTKGFFSIWPRIRFREEFKNSKKNSWNFSKLDFSRSSVKFCGDFEQKRPASLFKLPTFGWLREKFDYESQNLAENL